MTTWKAIHTDFIDLAQSVSSKMEADYAGKDWKTIQDYICCDGRKLDKNNRDALRAFLTPQVQDFFAQRTGDHTRQRVLKWVPIAEAILAKHDEQHGKHK